MEQLTEATFSETRGRHAIYDWDTILNGNIWKLTKGTDFQSSVLTFRSGAYQQARRRGLRLQTTIDTANNTIILRASPREPTLQAMIASSAYTAQH